MGAPPPKISKHPDIFYDPRAMLYRVAGHEQRYVTYELALQALRLGSAGVSGVVLQSTRPPGKPVVDQGGGSKPNCVNCGAPWEPHECSYCKTRK